MMPEARGYIFDLDGTLLHLQVDWEALRAELRSIADVAYEFKPVFQTLEKIISERPELRAPLFSKIDEFELAAAPDARLSDGSLEVLELLGRSSLLSLVTMQGSRAKNYLFRSTGLEPHFSSSFTRETSLDRATQLELALREMRLARGDVIFVGDRLNDLNAARKTGVRFIFVRGRMDSVDPEISYGSMSELLEALRSEKPVKLQ